MKRVLIAALMALGLSGCSISPEDQALIDSVVTALPNEVEGCSFVGNVDNVTVRPSIEWARDELRLQAARLGANHLVETHLAVAPYRSFLWSERDFDFPGHASMINATQFYMSGRAYLCPEGKGVKVAPPRALPQSAPHALPQAAPHALPQAAPHALPQTAPHALPQAAQQALPQSAPRALPQAATP